MTTLAILDLGSIPLSGPSVPGRVLLTNEMQAGIEPTEVFPMLDLDNECAAQVTPSGRQCRDSIFDSEMISTITPIGIQYLTEELDSEMVCTVS